MIFCHISKKKPGVILGRGVPETLLPCTFGLCLACWAPSLKIEYKKIEKSNRTVAVLQFALWSQNLSFSPCVSQVRVKLELVREWSGSGLTNPVTVELFNFSIQFRAERRRFELWSTPPGTVQMNIKWKSFSAIRPVLIFFHVISSVSIRCKEDMMLTFCLEKHKRVGWSQLRCCLYYKITTSTSSRRSHRKSQTVDLCFCLIRESSGFSVRMVIIGVKRRTGGLLGRHTNALRLEMLKL